MTKTQQPLEDIQMASNPGIKVVTGSKLKYLSEKINEFGSNHFFAVLDKNPSKESSESQYMKSIWGYSGKYYMEMNAVKLKEVESTGFKKRCSL